VLVEWRDGRYRVRRVVKVRGKGNKGFGRREPENISQDYFRTGIWIYFAPFLISSGFFYRLCSNRFPKAVGNLMKEFQKLSIPATFRNLHRHQQLSETFL
jgi:hypothetical protein